MDTLQNMPGLGEAFEIASDYGRDHRQFLGGHRQFEKRRYGALQGQSSRPIRNKNGAWISAILLRNVSGQALIGGNLAALLTAGTGGTGVIGGPFGFDFDRDWLYTHVFDYADTLRQRTVILIDPYVATVPDGFAFWGIYKGPAPGRTPQAAGEFVDDIVTGGPVYCSADALGRITGVGAPATEAEAQANALGILGTACEPADDSADFNEQIEVYWNIPVWG